MPSQPLNSSAQIVPLQNDKQLLNEEQRFRYKATLYGLRESYPFSNQYIGMTNPYTEFPIENDVQYDEYLRQRALSLVYANLLSDMQDQHESAVENLLSSRLDSEHKLSFMRTEMANADKRHRAQLRLRSAIVFVLIVALILFLSFIPDIKDNSYRAGFSQGEANRSEAYSQGYDKGIADGYNKGLVQGSAANDNSTSTHEPAGTHSNFGSAPYESVYIGNLNSRKFHSSSCSYLPGESSQVYFDTRNEAVAAGYTPCGHCDP